MLDWLIIGGGIHGLHCAHVLTTRRGVARERVRILDPHPAPLARWQCYTANTGMAFLRSPDVHHLDVHPMSLYHFARSAAGQSSMPFLNPYQRPALALFQAHVDWLVQRHALTTMWLVGQAEGLRLCQGGLRVETTHGALAARRVLLAIGSNVPLWPGWARRLRAAGAAIDHVFDPHFRRTALPPWGHAVILGGGITAVQTTLAMAQAAPGTVTLLSRHPLRVHQFDSDPCWIGPKCYNAFECNRDMARRRALLSAALTCFSAAEGTQLCL
jgi:cation diffusion facilitator CzcD-associated flavoprotein CzcO